ncbi:MAG TPA: hypothetical protein VJ845_00485 [Haploplasma sp.]|nr:hypothetical protein [Haploplasma sp.]
MQYEKLRYQPNKLSQLLTVLGMAFMTFALFKVINVYRYVSTTTSGIINPSMSIGFEILIAVGIMLISFLASEKFKSYDYKWGFVGIGLTAYPIVKIFIFPLSLNKTMIQLKEAGQVLKVNPTTWLWTVIISLIISAVFYGLATTIAIIRNNQLRQYYKELNSSDAN